LILLHTPCAAVPFRDFSTLGLFQGHRVFLKRVLVHFLLFADSHLPLPPSGGFPSQIFRTFDASERSVTFPPPLALTPPPPCGPPGLFSQPMSLPHPCKLDTPTKSAYLLPSLLFFSPTKLLTVRSLTPPPLPGPDGGIESCRRPANLNPTLHPPSRFRITPAPPFEILLELTIGPRLVLVLSSFFFLVFFVFHPPIYVFSYFYVLLCLFLYWTCSNTVAPSSGRFFFSLPPSEPALFFLGFCLVPLTPAPIWETFFDFFFPHFFWSPPVSRRRSFPPRCGSVPLSVFPPTLFGPPGVPHVRAFDFPKASPASFSPNPCLTISFFFSFFGRSPLFPLNAPRRAP